MSKAVHDDVLDAALDLLKQNGTRLTLTSQQPTTFTEADDTYKLADVTVDSSDYTIANGDVSGRKVTIGAQAAVDIDATGTSNHLNILDVANSKLLYTTTHTGQALTSGGTVDLSAWDIEIEDPA